MQAPRGWPAALHRFGGATAGLLLLLSVACAIQRPLPDGGTVQMQIGEIPAVLSAPGAPVLNGPPLRVLLRRQAQGLKISSPGGLRLRDPRSDRVLLTLNAQDRARLGALGNELTHNGRPLGVALARVEPLREGDSLKVAGRRYRGVLALKAQADQLLLLNVVGLEDYLKGVLPSEIPTDWPLEALKAQAVAARSFAVARLARAQADWDVDDSTSNQVYKGLDAERPASNRAVEETRGQVLAARGKVIEAFFHSNSGGHTASAAEVWGGDAPWLQGVPDGWSEDQKHYAWSVEIPLEQAERALTRAGLWKGLLTSVHGRDLSESGRWSKIELRGPDASRLIKSSDFRRALGADRLRSTRFRVRQQGETLVFEGLGWGHGVGLAQEGAYAQALHGRSWQSILSYYYPGAHLARIRH